MRERSIFFLMGPGGQSEPAILIGKQYILKLTTGLCSGGSCCLLYTGTSLLSILLNYHTISSMPLGQAEPFFLPARPLSHLMRFY